MYRSFRKQLSNEDILSFTPPGFKHNIDVQFPRRCLPVCITCKKKSKTRDHCRAVDCHTDLPWIETYVCISLDDSCIGNDGKILDGPFVAKTTKPIAFNLKGDLDPMTPVCVACREKSYTRNYCRRQKKHRQLPYSTVYAITSLKQNDMSNQSDSVMIPVSKKRSKIDAGESIAVDSIADILLGVNADDDAMPQGDVVTIPASRKRSKIKDAGERIVVEYIADIPVGINADDDAIIDDGENIEGNDKQPFLPRATNNDHGVKEIDTTTNESGIGGEKAGECLQDFKDVEGAKLDNIPRSRTFLVTVSSKLHRFEWVDIDPDVITHLQMCRENNLLRANVMSERVIFNGRNMHAIGGMTGEVDNPELTRMNSMSTMGSYISNTAGIPTTKVSRLIANESSIHPVTESQMMSSQMSQLGNQEMISHANQVNQLEIPRRTGKMRQMHQMAQIGQMNQMGVSNQHQMQAARRSGANSFMTQPMMMGGMPPYCMGVSGPDSSFRETMQYDPRLQLPFARNRMTLPGAEFNHTRGQAEFSHQLMPGANGIDVGSNVSGMPNVASGVGSRGHRSVRRTNYSGRYTPTDTRNTEGDSDMNSHLA